MRTRHDATSPGDLVAVEPQVRLALTEAEAALALVRGRPAVAARARLRFGPGRTCEPVARLLDRALVQAEKAGVDALSLVVARASALPGEDLVRVRRKGFGTADWINSPTCSVRIVLGPAGARTVVPPAREERAEPLGCSGDRAAQAPVSGPADDRADAVREALMEVIDPDLGVNVVDLGFVRAVALEGATATITMTLTSAACPLTSIIEKQVHDCLADVLSVADFRVQWEWVPAWRPADITAGGREQLRAIGFTV